MPAPIPALLLAAAALGTAAPGVDAVAAPDAAAAPSAADAVPAPSFPAETTDPRRAPSAAAPDGTLAPAPSAFERPAGTSPAARVHPPQPAESPGPAPGISTARLAAAGLVLAILAVAAALLARRRSGTRRQIAILETVPLGVRRCLVVARVWDDTMVLGVGEAGIAVLASRRGAHDAARSCADGAGQPPAPRLRAQEPVPAPARAPPGPPTDDAFELMLAETLDDRDLRARLAAGLGGTAR